MSPLARKLASEPAVFLSRPPVKGIRRGIRQMAESSVISTLLPATAFCLKEEYAPTRKMIDAAARSPLPLIYNPGSCFTNNIPLLVALGCIYEYVHRRGYHALTV